jgi:undecaprenyl-diphosphatase
MNPDSALFHLVNNLAGASPILDAFVSFLVNDYALPALFAFIVGALWFAGADRAQHERNQRGVLYTLLGLLIANVIVKACWMLFFRPRPFAMEDGVKLLFYRPSVSSFPSEPVATLTALAFGVFLFQPRLGSLMLGLTFAFAFGRVMAGVHYPSDVIVGVLIGVLAVYLPYRNLGVLDPLYGHLIRLANRFGLA